MEIYKAYHSFLTLGRYGANPTPWASCNLRDTRPFNHLPSSMLYTFVLRYFINIISTYAHPLNYYFSFLVAQKKTYRVDHERVSFFVYNVQAFKLLTKSLQFFLGQIKGGRRILFVCDRWTETRFGFRSLNFLFWPKLSYPALETLGRLDFYYNDFERTKFERVLSRSGCDFVVFAGHSYFRLNAPSMRKLGRVFFGITNPTMRPDLFDYTIPVVVSYEYTVAWIVGAVLMKYNLSHTS